MEVKTQFFPNNHDSKNEKWGVKGLAISEKPLYLEQFLQDLVDLYNKHNIIKLKSYRTWV